MIISNDFDAHTADALALQIEDLTNKDVDLTHREILAACVIAIGSTVHSIECRECRDIAVRFVKKILPNVIGHALKNAHSQPPPSDHVH